MPRHQWLRLLASAAALRGGAGQLCAQTRQVAGSRSGSTVASFSVDGVGTNTTLNNPYDAVMDRDGAGFYFSEQQVRAGGRAGAQCWQRLGRWRGGSGASPTAPPPPCARSRCSLVRRAAACATSTFRPARSRP